MRQKFLQKTKYWKQTIYAISTVSETFRSQPPPPRKYFVVYIIYITHNNKLIVYWNIFVQCVICVVVQSCAPLRTMRIIMYKYQ